MLLRKVFHLVMISLLAIHCVSCQEVEDKTCALGENGRECNVVVDAALLQQARDFGTFLDHVFQVNDSYEGNNRTQQEWNVLTAVLKYIDMDPNVLTTTSGAGNWYLQVHKRLTALAPPGYFFNIYNSRPTDRDIQVVAAMDRGAVESATKKSRDVLNVSFEDHMRNEAFVRFRFRGGTTRQARIFEHVVYNPLIFWTGFAVPNNQVLEKIASFGPLVEMGAGTAYWSALLRQQHGVDILAYDSQPPSKEHSNDYFHKTYTTVLPGKCVDVFEKHAEYKDRALLLIWPNSPDNVDQPNEFYSKELPPVWDADCLQAYMDMGGKTVVFVGEREENIILLSDAAPPESGMTATRQFQTLLQQHFELILQIDIPTWWSSDDATIWRRK